MGESVQAVRGSQVTSDLPQRGSPNPCTSGVVRYRRYNHYNHDIIPRSNLVEHGAVEKMQVNCWVSGEAGERLKALAKMQNVSYGQLLTALLLEQPIAVQDWQTAVSDLIQRISKIEASLSVLQLLQGGDELRELIARQDVRLNAIETAIMSGLTEGSEKVRVRIGSAENEAVEANGDRLSHQADHPLPTAQEFNQDKDQFRAAAVELYQQGETNSAEILRILTKQGYRNLEGKGYYRNDVAVAIKKARTAGLVE